MQLFGRINLISLCSMLKFWIIECGARLNPEELVTAVIDLAEYEYRGEAYAREELWPKSPRFFGRDGTRLSINVPKAHQTPRPKDLFVFADDRHCVHGQ